MLIKTMAYKMVEVYHETNNYEEFKKAIQEKYPRWTDKELWIAWHCIEATLQEEWECLAINSGEE